MKKIAMLFGLVLMAAATTASAQTSVDVQLGFGVPRPYIAGDIFIGPSFVRPDYRPYYYYYPDRYPYYFYDPLPLWYGPRHRVIVYERGDRFYRRDFDRERDWRRDWSQRHGHEWDWRRDDDRDDRGWVRGFRERGRDHDWDRHRRDRDRENDDNR